MAGSVGLPDMVLLGVIVVFVVDVLGIGSTLLGIYSSDGFVLFLHLPSGVVVYPLGHSSKQYGLEPPLVLIYFIV